jgi:hypothetical protein
MRPDRVGMVQPAALRIVQAGAPDLDCVEVLQDEQKAISLLGDDIAEPRSPATMCPSRYCSGCRRSGWCRRPSARQFCRSRAHERRQASRPMSLDDDSGASPMLRCQWRLHRRRFRSLPDALKYRRGHFSARTAQGVHGQPDRSDGRHERAIGRGRGTAHAGKDRRSRCAERRVRKAAGRIVDRVIDLPSAGAVADYRDADVYRAGAMPVGLLPKQIV